jgi:hypothetical protein
MAALASPSARHTLTKAAAPDRDGTVPVTSADHCYRRIQRSARDLLRRSNLSPVRACRGPVPPCWVDGARTWTHTAGHDGQAVLNALETELLDALRAHAQPMAAATAPLSSSSGPNAPLLVWRFEDGYRRGLAHAVCQYYGLRAGVGGDADDAGVHVWVSHAAVGAEMLPPIRLTAHLAGTSKAGRWDRDALADLVLAPPLVALCVS